MKILAHEPCCGSAAALAEEGVKQCVTIDFKITAYVAQNLRKSANAERVMRWNGDMVVCAFQFRRKAHVAAGLAGSRVAEFGKSTSEFVTGDITRKLQAEMTSSLTK